MSALPETTITMPRKELIGHVHTLRRSVMNLFAYVDAAEKGLSTDLMPTTSLCEAADSLEVQELEIGGGKMSAAPFAHPTGEAAAARLCALPEPQRSRMQILVSRSLNPRDDKPLGFAPTRRELVDAEEIAAAIKAMARASGLGPMQEEQRSDGAAEGGAVGRSRRG
jgi:hypothetical protein